MIEELKKINLRAGSMEILVLLKALSYKNQGEISDLWTIT